MNKYRNIKTVIDDIKFDSTLEARRYSFLKMMEKSGQISELKLQPQFLLQESFVFQGKRIRPILYIADFQYIYNGILRVEDAKSMASLTPLYKLKKKMLQFNYRDIHFYEIYKDNEIGGMV